MALHGIPGASGDLDLLIEPEESNVKRLSQYLGSRGYETPGFDIPERFRQGDRNFSCSLSLLKDSGFRLNVLLKTALPYKEFSERSVSMSFNLHKVGLVSLDDMKLIRSDSAG